MSQSYQKSGKSSAIARLCDQTDLCIAYLKASLTICPILLGQYNGLSSISYWAYFDKGKLWASQFYCPGHKPTCFRLEKNKQPDAHLSIEEAFSAGGRIYGGLTVKIPDLSGCKTMVIRCDGIPYRQHKN